MQGGICSSRPKQQALVHMRPIFATFPAVWGPGGGEDRGTTHTTIPSQAPARCISSESFWGDDCMLAWPVGALHAPSKPLVLRLLKWYRKCVLQKAFHFISSLNAIHLMNLAVQETFRIETHSQILQQNKKREGIKTPFQD